MKEDLIVKFWGVRGSYPTPGQDTVAFGGNTACVEIRAGEHVVILDAGTGIIPLGRDLSRRATQQKRPVEAVLLFSHLHHDHTQGFTGETWFAGSGTFSLQLFTTCVERRPHRHVETRQPPGG